MTQESDSNPPRDGVRPDPEGRPQVESHESIEEPRPRPRRWRWRNRLLLLCGAAILVVGGLAVWRYLSSYESTDDAQVDAHLHPVSTRIRGHVIRVNVGDNEYVEQGAVLVEIDPTDYRVAVDQAKADLATAEGYFYGGGYKDAKIFAARAQQSMKRGSPGWVRAQDIINFKMPKKK